MAELFSVPASLPKTFTRPILEVTETMHKEMFVLQLGNACGLVAGGLYHYDISAVDGKLHELVKPARHMLEAILADKSATFYEKFSETRWYSELSRSFKGRSEEAQTDWLKRSVATLQKLASGRRFDRSELEELSELMDILFIASAQTRQVGRERNRRY